MSRSLTFDFALLICLVAALLLQVYPLPESVNVWRTNFVLLLCCYLAFEHDAISALLFACLAGLITDLLLGSVLGRNGLALAISLAVLHTISPRIKHGSLWHETVIVATLTMICELTLQSMNLFTRTSIKAEWVLYPALSALLIWPVAHALLSKVLPARAA